MDSYTRNFTHTEKWGYFGVRQKNTIYEVKFHWMA